MDTFGHIIRTLGRGIRPSEAMRCEWTT